MKGLLRHSFLRRVSKDISALIGIAIVVSMVGMAIFSNFLATQNPLEQDLKKRLIPPVYFNKGTVEHPLGTDFLGRDIMSRILFGGRISLFIAFASVLIGVVIGTALGLICGYYEGFVDNVIMRIADVQLAFPLILLVIAVIGALGPSLTNMIVVLGITSWVRFARIVRGETLSIKEREFVMAVKAVGGNDFRTLTYHILPNVMPSIIVIATLELARIIMIESSLSFLGLGVPIEIPSWGGMLSEGRNYLATAWWFATFPGLAIVITILGINLTGDWLRDLLEPRFKGR
jgi:peptide/nickel transport system permease protein